MTFDKAIKYLIFVSPLFFPAYFIQFRVAGIPFTVLEAFCYLIFSVWLISVLLGKNTFVWDKVTKKYWYAVFILMAGVTFGVIAIPAFISVPSGETLNAREIALGIWKGWILAPMLYFAVLTQYLKTADQVAKLIRSYIYSSALFCVDALICGLFFDGITTDMRLRGFYESANYLALYLVPAVLFGIYFIVKKNTTAKLFRYLDISALTILIFSLLFTKSYAGIIAVFGSLVSTIIYQIFRYKKHRKKMIVTIISLFLLFSAAVLSQINSPKFRQALDYKNRSSTSVRLEIYRTSLDLIKMHPIFGVGPGLFQANYQNQAPITLEHAPLEWNMPHPHNIFLAFWLNAGILGLISFIVMIILVHRKFTYPLIAFWGIMIHGLFDMPFWKNDLAMIFWLVIACILVMQKIKHKNINTEGEIQ